jgi:glyoxylase-like metal-dependent hydrolase (beta-lactamase superfamily II)
MHTILALLTAVMLVWAPGALAQEGRPTLESVATAMGVGNLRSIEFASTPSPAAALPAMGEARQVQVVSGDHAWNAGGEAAAPAPVALLERQVQLWATPHGVVKAALANRAAVQGRTIALAAPGRFALKATLDDRNLVEKVEAVFSNPVVGDMRMEAVRQTANPYARVTSRMVADRALAVLAEVRKLAPGKPIRYAINSHHHFDHPGGLRAFAAEGATAITHEVNRPFFEQALAAPATMPPDHLTRSGRKGTVEGVRDRRVLTDGTRTVEIHHIAGNLHADGLLMVYLPREKLLSQADTYTPPPLTAPLVTVVNPNAVNLADSIARLGLAVDQLLPLHGRIVPLADLNKAIGRAN